MSRNTAPLWQEGLRPLYLLGSLDAGLSLLLWAGMLLGFVDMMSPAQHAANLLAGYVLAIVSGFLLTAVPKWTFQTVLGPNGLRLFSLAWIVGRIEAVTVHSFFVSGALALALLLLVGRAVVTSRQSRHLGVVASLGGLFLGLALWQFGSTSQSAEIVAIGAVALLISVIGGRITPSFIDNATQGPRAIRWMPLDIACLVTTLAAFLALAVDGGGGLTRTIALVAGVIQLVRLGLWRPLRGAGNPLLAILPVSYLWLPVGLLLLAADAPTIAVIHAITAGAIGSMTLAVMTRSSKGHTGRPLRATTGDIIAYLLVNIAALIRVMQAIGGETTTGLALSALLWAAAFLLFFVTYLPILIAPRLQPVQKA